MGHGGYQGPEPWEIEQAVENGVRRARGEHIPSTTSPYLNLKTCCCLVPAIFIAFIVVTGILAPITFKMGLWGP